MANEKDVKVVKLEQRIEVIGTGKYDMLKDVKYMVHPILAEKLVKKGAVTKK
jgi:hypothetical protein